MSALMAVATMADASDLLEGRAAPTEEVRHNAHQKPAPIPSRVELDRLAALRHDEALLIAPALAPDFEWDAVIAHRLEHARDIVRDTGPGLGLGRRLHRLTQPARRTYQLFASGLHQSGAPNPAI